VRCSIDRSAAAAASRRTALAAALGATSLVLLAGWYFILRSLSRERRAAELQSDFVAAVSHEFRSPLTSMAHLAEMLEADRVPSGEPTRASYRALVRDTHRLRRLVEDLLDFRRFEVGAGALRLEPVDLTDLVRTAIAIRGDANRCGQRAELPVAMPIPCRRRTAPGSTTGIPWPTPASSRIWASWSAISPPAATVK
jgi:signal transduction histidine kinase